ncbi:unnamed protein product [Medioppia subpectinata]|uniref:Uncharacterized protein n=1 Tax=Medioppia subpectinata TaxID=1979941 RepID=A0A7R9KXL8_9ACAR|nr:unnamed protein product [Medioppia subpectinata]CAG2111500.1 unnamed protein product [Medioppia subpectinata]
MQSVDLALAPWGKIHRKISDRKLVYLRDRDALWERKQTNLELSLTLSQENYFPNLLAHPVNKVPTKARGLLLKMINILVESGVNLISEERHRLAYKIYGHHLLSRELRVNNLLVIIVLKTMEKASKKHPNDLQNSIIHLSVSIPVPEKSSPEECNFGKPFGTLTWSLL